ncbi:MAG: Hsp70 family protein [Myxococcota bacterium]
MSSTVSLRITLRYKDLDEFGARYAENISSAGLFLRTRTPKPTGTRIRFELLLADGARAFFGEGVVVSVRHDDKAGMGIRYHSLDPDSQLVMEKVVAQHGEGPLAPTPLGMPTKKPGAAGGTGWRPGGSSVWSANPAPTARPSAPPSSGGLLPRDGWGRPKTPPKSDAPPPAPREARRRSSTLRPWEKTGSEVPQSPLAREDSVSKGLAAPEWDDLARTTIVGANSPLVAEASAEPATVRLNIPSAPPPEVPEELPAIQAWRPSAAPPGGRSVWTVPGEGPTAAMDVRGMVEAQAESPPPPAPEVPMAAAPAEAPEGPLGVVPGAPWLEEVSSSELEPLTIPVVEDSGQIAAASAETQLDLAAEARRAQEIVEARRAAEEAEAQRLADERRALEAARQAAEEAEAQRLADERRLLEEARQAAEEAEAQRLADERRALEAARQAAEEAEAQRLADERRLLEEARRAAEEAEALRLAEERRLLEEARRAAEEAEALRLAEERRLLEEARRAAEEAEALRLAEERRLLEEARLAAEEAEAQRLADERRALEEARRAAEEAEALAIAQAAAKEAEALRAAEEARQKQADPAAAPLTERVESGVMPIDELPRADATIADAPMSPPKSWASEVGPASNLPAAAGGPTERVDVAPLDLSRPILATGMTPEAALVVGVLSEPPELDESLVAPADEGQRFHASLPPEEGGTPGVRAPIQLAVREIDDQEAVLPFEAPSLGLSPDPTPAPRAAELEVAGRMSAAPVVDEAFARDEESVRQQSEALSKPPRSTARTIVERVPSSQVLVEPTGRLETRQDLGDARDTVPPSRVEVASELYRAEAPRAKPGDEAETALDLVRRAESAATIPPPRPPEDEGTHRIDVQAAAPRIDVNDVIAQSPARVPLEARTELLSSAGPPAPSSHPVPTLSSAVSVGPVQPSERSTQDLPQRREPSVAREPAASRAPSTAPQDLRRAVGIDIGGRAARLALLELGKVEMLKVEGGPSLPAWVALRADGTLVVGKDALEAPESARVSIRGLILAVSGLAAAPVESNEGRWVAKVAGQAVEILEIFRVFFQPLGEAATRSLASPKVRGILLVPPGTTAEAIGLLQRAAKSTGLDITEAVPEPLAAGRAYDLDHQPVETALVVDLGATHLSAAVLRRGREGMRPVAGKSWPSPSGGDIDKALAHTVGEELKKLTGKPPPEDASYLAQLEVELERGRRELRKEQVTELKLKLSDKVWAVKLARPRAYQATDHLVNGLVAKLREVLSDAGVHPRALGAVVLVGVASGYGAVAVALQTLTGREPLASVDREIAPFFGLIRASELIKAPEDRVAPTEGTPFDIGIGLPGGRFRALFPAGTKLPARQTKKHTTTKDGQTELEVALYEGRGELLSECRPLGTVILNGLPKGARGEIQVEVDLELDLDAVLSCTMSEAKSGHRRKVELPTANTPAARRKQLETRPSIEDFGPSAQKPKSKVGLLGRFFGKS